ncbi:hypothetical protein GTP41_05505 [Pseudoduganella sp. DS3]|uniref:Uncharacterized protein n=1 Tax=Pseudoduganella guangdongensis TaxID=2692179 RepID=A0A6N9HDR4_9BURK|nr:hypothetical protein [Pseudoduganella guangdongensis]MYN01549.1 hypothetical protein [Pseudoduganella guangdongensis]
MRNDFMKNGQSRHRLRVSRADTLESTTMRHITLEQFAEILEVMAIAHSIDSGIAITHVGEVGGRPTIAISTCNGDGDCFVMQ